MPPELHLLDLKVVGNPPFVEYAKIRNEYAVRNYKTEACGNLYAYVIERARQLGGADCHAGFILPMAGMSSRRMEELRRLLLDSTSMLHVSSYAGDAHPSILFEGVRLRLSIVTYRHIATSNVSNVICNTNFRRWYAAERDVLFPITTFCQAGPVLSSSVFPKLSGVHAKNVWGRLQTYSSSSPLAVHLETGCEVFYQEAAQYFVKATKRLPYFSKNGVEGAPPHGRFVICSELQAPALVALLSSTLFYFWYHAISDCYHVSDSVVQTFPTARSVLYDAELAKLGVALESQLHSQAKIVSIKTTAGDEIAYAAFNYQDLRPILGEIDRVIAHHYGLADEETDFVRGYDVKYRMGQGMDDTDD